MIQGCVRLNILCWTKLGSYQYAQAAAYLTNTSKVNLLTEVLGDILRLHPVARMIHIGCRRPMMLGWSLLSK